MDRILKIRLLIYDHFHGTDQCRAYFFDAHHKEEYVAYYNSMYLLQDSTESLLSHRYAGFSNDPMKAYIEFWGVMQAVSIQQDAIRELFLIMTGSALTVESLRAWEAVRALRNVCAGHPVKKDRPKRLPLSRSFMGRGFGDYNEIMYERWQRDTGTTQEVVNLGALLDEYSEEAAGKLDEVFLAMKTRWQQKTPESVVVDNTHRPSA